MRTWGIGYDVMQQLKPDIIYVSMAGFGHSGRHHHYTTMGPSAQALSGQTSIWAARQTSRRLGLVVSGWHTGCMFTG